MSELICKDLKVDSCVDARLAVRTICMTRSNLSADVQPCMLLVSRPNMTWQHSSSYQVQPPALHLTNACPCEADCCTAKAHWALWNRADCNSNQIVLRVSCGFNDRLVSQNHLLQDICYEFVSPVRRPKPMTNMNTASSNGSGVDRLDVRCCFSP